MPISSTILAHYDFQCLHVHKFIMALLDIALLQANAHGQDLGLWHLRSLGPLLRPLGQMALVKAVRGWDFTPGDSERTSYSLEHKAAG